MRRKHLQSWIPRQLNNRRYRNAAYCLCTGRSKRSRSSKKSRREDIGMGHLSGLGRQGVKCRVVWPARTCIILGKAVESIKLHVEHPDRGALLQGGGGRCAHSTNRNYRDWTKQDLDICTVPGHTIQVAGWAFVVLGHFLLCCC